MKKIFVRNDELDQFYVSNKYNVEILEKILKPIIYMILSGINMLLPRFKYFLQTLLSNI